MTRARIVLTWRGGTPRDSVVATRTRSAATALRILAARPGELLAWVAPSGAWARPGRPCACVAERWPRWAGRRGRP